MAAIENIKKNLKLSENQLFSKVYEASLAW
jgi:hypothetical protein